MVAASSSDGQSGITTDLLVLVTFLISGLLSGLLFASLTTRPSLETFWFIKRNKVLIPRYSYWIAFSLILLAGLTAGYSVSLFRSWIQKLTTCRHLLAAGSIIALSAPLPRFITPPMRASFGLTWDWDFVFGSIAFLILLSFALCLLTGSLRLLPVAIVWNSIFAAAAFVFVFTVLRIFNLGTSFYEFVQWPILESMLALSYGNWIIWRQRFCRQPAAQQTRLSRSGDSVLL